MNPPAPPKSFSFLSPKAKEARIEIQSNAALDRAARSYHSQCVSKASALKAAFMLHKLKSWDNLGIEEIPLSTTSQPLSFTALQAFLLPWVATSETRFKFNETQRKVEVADVSTKFEKAVSHGITKVGRFFLRPRQKKAIDKAIEALRSGSTQAVVVPLEGGEGKSVIGWGLIKYWQDNSYFGHTTALIPMLPNQAFFSTAAGVVIDMESRARACEVANIHKGVTVMSHTKWASKEMAPFFREEKIETYGNVKKVLRYIMPPPVIMIVDENDAYKKPTSRKSRYLLSVIEAGLKAGSVCVFMSATPWVTINDTWLFCIATGKKWQGEPISMENFPSMARAIAARAGVSPDKPSKRAMEEFRKEFADCYVVPPRDPRTVKKYDDIMLLDFATPEHRMYYGRTIERYQEEQRRIGEGDRDINRMTSLLKLRQAEEWLKCQKPYFPHLAVESHKKGFAPVIGLSFEASVNNVVRSLVYDYGIPRSKISVIQGGSELLSRDKLAAIIGPDLFEHIGEYVMRYYPDVNGEYPNPLSPRERGAVRKYLKWIRERVRFEETEGAQAMRQSELAQLRLGKQSLAQRHDEKERFQNGETEFMVFTLSSGGRGIDMDQQFEHVRPREGFFTICYWAEEYAQALYRLMRVATLSDVHQHSVFFAGTEVANHVAPILDKKLKSLRAAVVGGEDIAEEIISLLSRPTPVKLAVQQDFTESSEDDTAEGFDPDALAEQLAKIDDDDDE